MLVPTEEPLLLLACCSYALLRTGKVRARRAWRPCLLLTPNPTESCFWSNTGATVRTRGK